MELTDNDKQRIEHEAQEKFGQFRKFSEQRAMIIGAEYATRYEREQQKKEKRGNRWFKDWRKLIDVIIPPGPMCRDCADGDGTCDSDGLPCEPTDRAIAIFKRLEAERTALTKENERLKGGSIENPDHHIKVLKEQISRMEDEYKALTEQVEKLKIESSKFAFECDRAKEDRNKAERELSRLREERKELLEKMKARLERLQKVTGYSSGFSDIHLEMDFLQSLLSKFPEV